MRSAYAEIKQYCDDRGAELLVVSKTKPAEDIREIYHQGQRVFGENRVQELLKKQPELPADIQWHLIGHLQTNKVKYLAPVVTLIHSIDSLKLLEEVNRQAEKNNRRMEVLLQLHIAREETKFGLSEKEAEELLQHVLTSPLHHVTIRGLMGMASLTEDEERIRREFRGLKSFFDRHRSLQSTGLQLHILSMGMSSDYRLAIDEGSTMVRIGSAIFSRH
jgi:hypothetical protein